MILSIIDRYVDLCVNRLKLEDILRKASERNDTVLVNEINDELYRLNQSINFIHECIIKRLSTSSSSSLNDLNKCLERKSAQIRKSISITNATIKMMKDNAKIAISNNDRTAAKRYKELIEESDAKKREQLEELNCYDCVASICSKVQYLSLKTK